MPDSLGGIRAERGGQAGHGDGGPHAGHGDGGRLDRHDRGC
jgi:hypothetical protein